MAATKAEPIACLESEVKTLFVKYGDDSICGMDSEDLVAVLRSLDENMPIDKVKSMFDKFEKEAGRKFTLDELYDCLFEDSDCKQQPLPAQDDVGDTTYDSNVVQPVTKAEPIACLESEVSSLSDPQERKNSTNKNAEDLKIQRWQQTEISQHTKETQNQLAASLISFVKEETAVCEELSKTMAEESVEEVPLKITHGAGNAGITYDESGMILSVKEGGAAHKSGIRTGMRMLTIDDEDFSSELFQSAESGTKRYDVEYSLVEMERIFIVTFQVGRTGVTHDIDDGTVLSVVEGGQAQNAGVKIGMEILAVNGESFENNLYQEAVNGKTPFQVVYLQPSKASQERHGAIIAQWHYLRKKERLSQRLPSPLNVVEDVAVLSGNSDSEPEMVEEKVFQKTDKAACSEWMQSLSTREGWSVVMVFDIWCLEEAEIDGSKYHCQLPLP